MPAGKITLPTRHSARAGPKRTKAFQTAESFEIGPKKITAGSFSEKKMPSPPVGPTRRQYKGPSQTRALLQLVLENFDS